MSPNEMVVFSGPLKPAKDETPTPLVGLEFPVGEFYWIKTCVGFAENAKHGQGFDPTDTRPGSADTKCRVRVMAEREGFATLVLLRTRVAGGAQAPHGTIFLLPSEQLFRWSKMACERQRREDARREFRRQLGRVVV